MNSSSTALVQVVSQIRYLMLDFDGPVCKIFAGYPAATIAEDLRRLYRHYHSSLPTDMASTDDPLHILRLSAYHNGKELTQTISTTLRRAEMVAIEVAEPTPGALQVLQAARLTGRHIAIVSNNSRAAITAYLGRHNLATYIDAVVGRHDDLDPRLLKPSGYLMECAITNANTPRRSIAMVGDSITDIMAAQATSITSIGYANKPNKHEALTNAGANIVIESMKALAEALNTTSP